MRDSRRGRRSLLQPHGFLAAPGFAALILLISHFLAAKASALDPVPPSGSVPAAGAAPSSDLADRAVAENLPQVSTAVLRTRIQQEKDPVKRLELTRHLVALLVSGGRPAEALAVSTTVDAEEDPTLAYWKAAALMGTGDSASARVIFDSLIKAAKAGAPLPGIDSDQIILGLARALRGSNDPAAALGVLEGIPAESPVAGDAILERCADLLALGRTEVCLKLLQSYNPPADGAKASAAYLKALALWRSGNVAAAGKLFVTVPAGTPWTASASAIGGALCLSSAGKPQEGIDLLEKRLNAADGVPLIEEQFRLLDQLNAAAATPDTTNLKKWAEDPTRAVRGRLASYYQASGELRLHHTAKAEELLENFIRTHPDDSLAEEARILLASSKLQQGKVPEAISWSADHPSAPPALRARLAYLSGLAAASAGQSEVAKKSFQSAAALDPELARNALFNSTILVATTDRGSLDASRAAQDIVEMDAGVPGEEMQLQIALDLLRRGQPSGIALLGELAGKSSDPSLKSRAQLAAAEFNMKSGRGEAANQDLAKAVKESSGDPERDEYLDVFLKDTGKKSDAPAVISSARAFLKARPDSRFLPEVRLKLADALLSTGDVQGARIEFEQLASSGSGTDLGRRALFLAAQSAARSMDPASIDDSIMLLERVAEGGKNDQLAWQARLQQGALKNAQDLPMEALAIYDKILSSKGPDTELRAAALMARADTLHQLGAKEASRERESLAALQQIAEDPSLSLRWRNQALCKSGILLEKLGEGDAALASYYQAFKNPRTDEPEQRWHDKAAFEAARLLESRKQWKDAVTLYGQIAAEGGPRAEEAKSRLAKLRLENFLWEN